MKVLELFSGTESFSKVARDRGHQTFTVDKEKKFNPNLTKDLWDVELGDIPFKPDVIWASPPCTHFSIATHRYWANRKPSIQSMQSFNLILRTLSLIMRLNPRFWILENPKSRLRWLLGNPPNTVYYGSYDHPVLKPTDLWGFYPEMNFPPKPKMKSFWSYDIPRDSKSRGIVPRKLCEHIIKILEKNIKKGLK